MIKSKSYPLWPQKDDRTVVEEMLRNSKSSQWSECREFVKRLVQINAKNIPSSSWDDIVQDVILRVNKSLPAFGYRSALGTWLFVIVRNCIIDSHRKLTRAGPFMAPHGDPQVDDKSEDDELTDVTSRSAEDECITHEELNQALAALQEFVSIHAKPLRNGRILDMVLFEGRSLEQAARAVGCSAPVAGYVVREAQRFVREKLRFQR